MKSKRIAAGSKKLSWLLRHGAHEEGLKMDAAGWAPVRDVLALTKLGEDDLRQIVSENNKSRYQLDGKRVRASQGHSLSGTPVTQEALEASWETLDLGEQWVFHGTRADEDVLRSIGAAGLLPGERTHVHLADSPGSGVGKRANVGVLLEVSASALQRAGIGLFRSPNGVVLARSVPPACITGLRALTKRARKNAAELRAAIGLSIG
jgi:putative RNA 2'-phosphotransferase